MNKSLRAWRGDVGSYQVETIPAPSGLVAISEQKYSSLLGAIKIGVTESWISVGSQPA